MATAHLFPLLLVGLHLPVVMSSLWALQYYKDHATSIDRLDILTWLVPVNVSLLGDIFALVNYIITTFTVVLSTWRAGMLPASGMPGLGLGIALLIFYILLILSSFASTIAFWLMFARARKD